MSRPRIVMRKIRDVLRLSFGERLPRQRVSQATGLPPTTVFDYLKRAAAAGCSFRPGRRRSRGRCRSGRA
jgi:hypothetical protein